MKRIFSAIIALGLAVTVFGSANAGNHGMEGGCGNCAQAGAPTDQFRKFQLDTIDLRQEMMMKRFEAQRENLKATPDNAKIDALKADIKAIQARIHQIKTMSGLPTDKCDGECDQKIAGCNKMGKGGCGKGMGGDGMGGCNKGPCGKM